MPELGRRIPVQRTARISAKWALPFLLFLLPAKGQPLIYEEAKSAFSATGEQPLVPEDWPSFEPALDTLGPLLPGVRYSPLLDLLWESQPEGIRTAQRIQTNQPTPSLLPDSRSPPASLGLTPPAALQSAEAPATAVKLGAQAPDPVPGPEARAPSPDPRPGAGPPQPGSGSGSNSSLSGFCQRYLARLGNSTRPRAASRTTPGECGEIAWMYPICSACAEDGSFNVTIDPSRGKLRPFIGWGTSLSWASRFLANETREFQDLVLDYLFSKEKGLGLDIARYIIPGSYSEATQNQSGPFDLYVSQGYVPERPSDLDNVSTWQFDWSADVAQRDMLMGAIERGVQHLEAISHSPPWWLTASGDVTGAEQRCNGTSCAPYVEPNLPNRNIRRFAVYISEVLKGLNNVYNLSFQGVSPFNEPMEGWWFKGGYHEGCSMRANGILATAFFLQKELRSAGLKRTKVMVADSWSYATANMLRNALKTKGLLKPTKRIGVHGYRHPDQATQALDTQYYGAVRALAAQARKPVWQTEWGPMGGEQLCDTTFDALDSAMWLARSVVQHLNIMGASAWLYWHAYEPCLGVCGFWGLIQRGYMPNRPRLTPQYYAMQHFTRLSPKGSLIIPMAPNCHHGVLATYRRFRKLLTVHVVNQRNVSGSLQLCFEGLRVPQGQSLWCQVRVTSRSEKFAPKPCVGVPAVNASSAAVDMPCFTAEVGPTSIASWVMNLEYQAATARLTPEAKTDGGPSQRQKANSTGPAGQLKP